MFVVGSEVVEAGGQVLNDNGLERVRLLSGDGLEAVARVDGGGARGVRGARKELARRVADWSGHEEGSEVYQQVGRSVGRCEFGAEREHVDLERAGEGLERLEGRSLQAAF